MKKFIAAIALVAAALTLAPVAAHAAAEPTPNVVEDASGTLWIVSAWWVTVISAAVIPFVTGLVTKWNTRSGAKTAITIVLNLAVASFSTAVLEDGTALISGQMVQTFIQAVLISFASYEWGWKKAGLTSSAIALPDPQREGGIKMVPGKLAFVGRK